MSQSFLTEDDRELIRLAVRCVVDTEVPLRVAISDARIADVGFSTGGCIRIEVLDDAMRGEVG